MERLSLVRPGAPPQTSEAMLYRALVTATGLVSLLVFIAATVASVVVALVVQVPVLPWDRHRRVALRVEHWLWGRLIFTLMPSLAITRETEALVGEGPWLVVCNHSSMLDIPACMGLDLPLRVVGKRSLFAVPGLRQLLRLFGHVEVPGDSREAVARFMDQCRASLDQGLSLLLFPEGTRSPDGRLQSFHRGAFRLAVDTGTPVLPVVVRGSWFAYPRGYFVPRVLFQRLYLDVLPPVDPEGRTARALSNEVHRRMEAFLEDHPVSPDFPIPPPPSLEASP